MQADRSGYPMPVPAALNELCALQDPNDLMAGNADGFVAAQIFYDAFKARYGNGKPGTIMMVALPGSACVLCAPPTHPV